MAGSAGCLTAALLPEDLKAEAWENFPQRALELFANERKTCSEAIVMACCEALGIDDSELSCAVLGFASGIAGMGKTCGVVTASSMMLSLLEARQMNPYKRRKKLTFMAIKSYMSQFNERFGHTDCRKLIEVSTSEAKKSVRRNKCERYVLHGARMLMRQINK